MELAGRSTVREAIKILVSKNILEVNRGKSTFVSENPGIIKDPLGVTFMNEKVLHYYLFETKLIIEPEIAALCVDRISDTQLEELKATFQKMKDKIIKKEDHTEWDKKFHYIIAESTGNPIVKRIVPIISDSITKGYKETKKRPKSGKIVIRNHQNLLDAIPCIIVTFCPIHTSLPSTVSPLNGSCSTVGVTFSQPLPNILNG